MSNETPNHYRSHSLWIVGLTSLLLAAGSAGAATKKSASKGKGKEAYYRCKGADGQPYFGQSIPPECMDLDVEVLDGHGQVMRIIEGRASLQTRVQRDAEIEAKKQAALAAQQRDRTLLATYLTVSDIESLRDQRLEQLQAQAHVTSQYIVNLQERESRLIVDAARYRPYAKSGKAPPVPDHLAQEMVNTVNGLQVYREELAKNTVEQTRLRDEFSSDITRFKQLKGLN